MLIGSMGTGADRALSLFRPCQSGPALLGRNGRKVATDEPFLETTRKQTQRCRYARIYNGAAVKKFNHVQLFGCNFCDLFCDHFCDMVATFYSRMVAKKKSSRLRDRPSVSKSIVALLPQNAIGTGAEMRKGKRVPGVAPTASNEILALQAKGGDGQAVAELWEQNLALISQMIWKWYAPRREMVEKHGAALEDLEQEGYFAVAYAAAKYDPNKGRFSTYLWPAIRRQLQKAVFGESRITGKGEDGRPVQRPADAIYYCQSLDEPLQEDDDATALDGIEDPAGQESFFRLEAEGYQADLHRVLMDALALLDGTTKRMVLLRYFGGWPASAIAADAGCTEREVETGIRRAFSLIRHSKAGQMLAEYLPYGRKSFYSGVGATRYKERFLSSVEQFIEDLEEKAWT